EGTWPAPLVRDADYAVKALTRSAPPAPRPSRVGNAPRRTRIARGLVTAACAAGGGNAIFLGFEEGGVFCYRPDRNEVQLVAAYDLPVASLAVDHAGASLVVLRVGSHERGAISTYARSANGAYRPLVGHQIDGLADPWLTPVLSFDGEHVVGLWEGQGLFLMMISTLTSSGRMSLPRPDAQPPAALLLANE